MHPTDRNWLRLVAFGLLLATVGEGAGAEPTKGAAGASSGAGLSGGNDGRAPGSAWQNVGGFVVFDPVQPGRRALHAPSIAPGGRKNTSPGAPEQPSPWNVAAASDGGNFKLLITSSDADKDTPPVDTEAVSVQLADELRRAPAGFGRETGEFFVICPAQEATSRTVWKASRQAFVSLHDSGNTWLVRVIDSRGRILHSGPLTDRDKATDVPARYRQLVMPLVHVMARPTRLTMDIVQGR